MALEKREQVFVSSTYLDLKEERQEVIQTLLEADCIPAGMELFPASDDDKWTLIRRVIDDSDYYLVVIGGRYGSVDPDRGLSFTEMEFDYAVEQGIPVMGFLHGDPGKILGEKLDLDPEMQKKLNAFREKIESRMVKYWTSPEALGGQVAKSLIQIRKTHPAEGWVRAGRALTPELEQELAVLRAQNAELRAELDAKRSLPNEFIDGMARGDDPFEIRYTLWYWDGEAVRHGSTWPQNRKSVAGTVNTSWDASFSAIAPLMVDEASESNLKKALERHVASLVPDKEIPDDLAKTSDLLVRDEDWQQLKVQLLALGLIEQSNRRRGVNDKSTYWTLTQAGSAHLLRLKAVRRPIPDPTDADMDASDSPTSAG